MPSICLSSICHACSCQYQLAADHSCCLQAVLKTPVPAPAPAPVSLTKVVANAPGPSVPRTAFTVQPAPPSTPIASGKTSSSSSGASHYSLLGRVLDRLLQQRISIWPSFIFPPPPVVIQCFLQAYPSVARPWFDVNVCSNHGIISEPMCGWVQVSPAAQLPAL